MTEDPYRYPPDHDPYKLPPDFQEAYDLLLNSLDDPSVAAAASCGANEFEVQVRGQRYRAHLKNMRITRIEKLKRSDALAASNPAVPYFTAKIICSIAAMELRDGVLGDLEEQFSQNIERIGLKRARRHYALAVMRSLVPLLVDRASRFRVTAAIRNATGRYQQLK